MAVSSINSVVLVGNLTRNAEFKAGSNSNGSYYIINFSIALNRSARDKNGAWEDKVSYIDVTYFSKSSSLDKYLLKGKQIAIQGELRQDRWEKDGKTNSRIYVFANNVQLLGGANQGMPTQNKSEYKENKTYDSESRFEDDDIDDDDIVPF